VVAGLMARDDERSKHMAALVGQHTQPVVTG
jgi:hypothetical protein